MEVILCGSPSWFIIHGVALTIRQHMYFLLMKKLSVYRHHPRRSVSDETIVFEIRDDGVCHRTEMRWLDLGRPTITVVVSPQERCEEHPQ